MSSRPAAAAAAIAFAACSSGAPWPHDPSPQEVPQSGAQTSHRMRSVDEVLHGRKYLKEVKVQPAQASALALQACPGRILFQSLEKGGGRLRYVFVVERSRGLEQRVAVDALTGAVLENVSILPPN